MNKFLTSLWLLSVLSVTTFFINSSNSINQYLIGVTEIPNYTKWLIALILIVLVIFTTIRELQKLI